MGVTFPPQVVREREGEAEGARIEMPAKMWPASFIFSSCSVLLCFQD